MDASMSYGFVQLSRDPKVDDLMKQSPNAFMLVTQIARRARRDPNGFNPHGLALGEALVGDHKSIGLTEQQYRTAKNQLTKWGIATFQSTTLGSRAKLCDSSIYNVNLETGNGQNNGQVTTGATGNQRTGNGRVTTKKNGISKEGEESSDPRFTPVTDGFSKTYKQEFEGEYAHKGGQDGKALKTFLARIKPDVTAEKIIEIIARAMARRKLPFATACKKATTIHGFCENWNEIRSELSTPETQQNGHQSRKPAAPELRPGDMW